MINKFFSKENVGIHAFVKTQTSEFNKKVARGDTFVVYPFENMPMNATSTRYPELDRSNDLIIMHVDGRFMDLDSKKVNHVALNNDVWTKRQSGDLEQ